MTQKAQFTMSLGPQTTNVTSTDLATYLAAGWSVSGVKYCEGGEAPDTSTLFLMDNGNNQTFVKTEDVSGYLENGYVLKSIKYSGVTYRNNVSFKDIPALLSAEVGTVADTIVVATFSTEIHAADYAAGVVIKVATVSKTISAAELQTDGVTVHYTIPAVTNGQAVTIEYSSATGGIHSAHDNSYMDSLSATEVTNNVPGE